MFCLLVLLLALLFFIIITKTHCKKYNSEGSTQKCESMSFVWGGILSPSFMEI